MISTLALILLAFAHKPVVIPAYSAAELAAFALPDGSLPDLCLPSGASQDDGKYVHDRPCEACRISAAGLLPAPPRCFGPRLLIAHIVTRAMDAPLLWRDRYPPAAPPHAPPVV
ncbi:MAG: hypothetical protein ACRECW_03400 [Phyllobacterium sp.]